MKSFPYVKLEYSEAISAKKELLSSQANILRALKSIQSYKLLRRKELIKKAKLRLIINSLNKKIKNTILELPQVEGVEEIELPQLKEVVMKKSINAELAEIQEKLAKLEEQ